MKNLSKYILALAVIASASIVPTGLIAKESDSTRKTVIADGKDRHGGGRHHHDGRRHGGHHGWDRGYGRGASFYVTPNYYRGYNYYPNYYNSGYYYPNYYYNSGYYTPYYNDSYYYYPSSGSTIYFGW